MVNLMMHIGAFLKGKAANIVLLLYFYSHNYHTVSHCVARRGLPGELLSDAVVPGRLSNGLQGDQLRNIFFSEPWEVSIVPTVVHCSNSGR